MNNYLFLILALFCFSCVSKNKKTEIFEVAMENYITHHLFIYPVEEQNFLMGIFKNDLEKKIRLSIDSIIEINLVQSIYGSCDISPYKLKAIFRELMEKEIKAKGLRISIISKSELSNWSKELISYHYNCQPLILTDFNIKSERIDGIPFLLDYFTSKKSLPLPKDEYDCVKYLTVSPIFKCGDFFFLEVSDYCFGGPGGQTTLIVMKEFSNKIIIENKLTTELVF